jgi:hypothetical protein
VDPDLLSACIFCGTLLLRSDLPAPKGWNGEIGASYATMGRQNETPGVLSNDESDQTAKFALIGLRRVWLAPGDLGAGTPMKEWRLRVAIGNSHDEATQTDYVPGNISAAGDGRYDNFSGLYRQNLGAKDSLEVALEQRFEKTVDLVTESHHFSEERTLFGQRVDATLGWRHRWNNLEVSGAFLAVRAEGQYRTEQSFREGWAWLPGGSLEARGRWKGWTLTLDFQGAGANMPMNEELQPDFTNVSYDAHGRFRMGAVSLQKTFGGTDIFFSASLDRSNLPFVVMSVLGQETGAFDMGYRPTSETKQWIYDLELRQRIAAGVHLRAYFRLMQGNETVSLTDPRGMLPDISIPVRRGGRHPSTEFLLGGGADFTVGSPPSETSP